MAEARGWFSSVSVRNPSYTRIPQNVTNINSLGIKATECCMWLIHILIDTFAYKNVNVTNYGFFP